MLFRSKVNWLWEVKPGAGDRKLLHLAKLAGCLQFLVIILLVDCEHGAVKELWLGIISLVYTAVRGKKA